jgi:hypothetical protein
VQIVPDVVLPGINDSGRARYKLFQGAPPALNPMLGTHPTAAPQANSSSERSYAIPLGEIMTTLGRPCTLVMEAIHLREDGEIERLF